MFRRNTLAPAKGQHTAQGGRGLGVDQAAERQSSMAWKQQQTADSFTASLPLVPPAGGSLSSVVEAVFRRAELSISKLEGQREVRLRKQQLMLLLHDVDREEMDARCGEELRRLEAALQRAGKAMDALNQRCLFRRLAPVEHGQAVLAKIEEAIKDDWMALASKWALLSKACSPQYSELPRGLTGPLRTFWEQNFGDASEAPWAQFRTRISSNVSQDLMSSFRRTILSVRPDLSNEAQDGLLDRVLRSCFDPDGRGIVSVHELNNVMQRCRRWAAARPQSLGLDRCLSLLAEHVPAELPLPSDHVELERLRRWLVSPEAGARHASLQASKFQPGSRPLLMQELHRWLVMSLGSTQSRAMVVYGKPGSGKTVMSAMLVRQTSLVHAAHFCRYDDAETLDLQLLIGGLAVQLAAHLPPLRRALSRLAGGAGDKLPQFRDEVDAFKQLLQEPLRGISSPKGSVVVLLDGMDEGPRSRSGSNPLLDLLLGYLVELPSWLRFIITSRPDQFIKDKLHARFAPVALDMSDPRLQTDLRALLASRLRPLVGSDLDLMARAEEEIFVRSEGSYMYAIKALDALDDAQRQVTDRKVSLAEVCNLPIGQRGVFRSISKKYLDPSTEMFPLAMELLEVLTAARSPPSVAQAQQWLGITTYEFEVKLLPRLGGLVKVEGGTTQVLRIYHKAVYDWVVEAWPSGCGVLPGDGHAVIAEHVLQEHTRGGTFSSYFLLHGLAHLAHATLAAPVEKQPRWASALEALASDPLYWAQVAKSEARGRVLSEVSLYSEALQTAVPDEHLADALARLAREAAHQGLVDEATMLYQKALSVSNKALGPEAPSTVKILLDQAWLLQDQGWVEESGPLYQRALAIREKTLGPEHPDTAAVLTAVAAFHHSQGQYEQALPLHQRALAILERELGPEDPGILDALGGSAVVLAVQGRYEEALPLMQRVLEVSEKSPEVDQRDVAQALNDLAVLMQAQGRAAEALPLLERALAACEVALGPDHPYTAQALTNLAGLLYSQEQYEQALPLFSRALSICEASLGPEHRDTAVNLYGLAGLFQVQGRFDEALRLYQRALAITEQALGPDHRDNATHLNNLARLLQSQGDYDQALPLHQRALAIFERVLGPEHPHVGPLLQDIAVLYLEQRKFSEALPLCKRALEISERSLGPDHLQSAHMLTNLARCYKYLKEPEEARPLYRQALSITERVLGREHPETATALHNLACLLEMQGWYDEALPLYQRALATFEKVLGPDHPDTETTARALSRIVMDPQVSDEFLYDEAQDHIARPNEVQVQTNRMYDSTLLLNFRALSIGDISVQGIHG